MFWFCSTMSVECTNPNLKSAQLAKLGQPAPKLELDLYIPWIIQSKIKNSFVIGRQKGINGERREKKSLQHVIYWIPNNMCTEHTYIYLCILYCYLASKYACCHINVNHTVQFSNFESVLLRRRLQKWTFFLTCVIHPRLDLVNVVIRPFLFTKLSLFTKSSLNKGKI